MTIKRLVLVMLTVLAIALIGQDLLSSWNQPQIQSRLELYQTNLLLQASDLQAPELKTNPAQAALLGKEPIKAALEQYQNVRELAQKNLEKTRTLLAEPSRTTPKASATQDAALQQAELKLERLIAELDLNLGLLQTRQGESAAALKTWKATVEESSTQTALQPLGQAAQVLSSLWSMPPQIVPDAERSLKKTLDGWFRTQALTRLYQLQQRQEALTELQAIAQQSAERSLGSLVVVAGVPVVGCVIGIVVLGVLLVQWVVQRKQSLLAGEGILPWTTPWDGEIIWQVLIFGFFLVGQLAIPLLFSLLQQSGNLNPSAFGERGKAIFILINYLLLAAGGLGVLYVSIQPFLPLPEGWFQFKLNSRWWIWGLGGYAVAIPLVVLVSLINQQIWQGQGGSNPILPIALEGKDSTALTIFFLTAAVAAPIFEEILFRGFLLPSLTRYLPVWGAIALSAVIFAVAHLSLSEVLPLTTLGIVLGFVYARSRNLLASMLLHSLWNTGTLLSLMILGSSGSQ